MWQQPEPALLPRARLARHESVGVVRSALYESLVWVGGLCGSLWCAQVARLCVGRVHKKCDTRSEATQLTAARGVRGAG